MQQIEECRKLCKKKKEFSLITGKDTSLKCNISNFNYQRDSQQMSFSFLNFYTNNNFSQRLV